jgi:Fic family protein
MAELIATIGSPIHPIERAARAHFDLLTIHPFADGNGRTARLLQNLLLIQAGFVPILIGPDDRPTYFDVLQAAQTAVPGYGDPEPFISYIIDLEERELSRYLRALS